MDRRRGKLTREILFRGQTRKRGEKVNMAGKPLEGNWVYGGVLQGTGDFSVIYGSTDPDNISASKLEKHVVYTDTLGEYTGLSDKNEKKIFEGDIVRHYNRPDEPESYSQGVIFWDGVRCEWRRTAENNYDTWKIHKDCIYEIIGNIHDNPELVVWRKETDNG